MKRFFLINFLFIGSFFAEIIEVSTFAEVEKHLDEETLLLLDIDDTLLIPVQMLGCDEWFNEYVKKCGLEQAIARWEAIRHITKMEIVEPGSESLVQKWQNAGIPIMGFTTQGIALATRTSQQLKMCGVDLKRSAPQQKDVFISVGDHGILYRNGILFTSGTHKGEAFFAFVDTLKLGVQKVVFLNDKASHLKEIEDFARERNIPFVGLRYSYSDERKKQYDSSLAEVQFTGSSFEAILSDEEAQMRIESYK